MSLNPTGNIFNSTISEYEEHMRDKYPGTFNPDYKIIWVLMQMQSSYQPGYIKPEQKEILRLKAATAGDDYVLNTTLACSVNATAPELCP